MFTSVSERICYVRLSVCAHACACVHVFMYKNIDNEMFKVLLYKTKLPKLSTAKLHEKGLLKRVT